MPNEQLISYIRSEFVKGVDRATVMQSLLATGWKVEDINIALASIYGVANQNISPVPQTPSTPAQSGYVSQTGSPQSPIQVENVQYGVTVGSYLSRVSLAFMVASTSLAVIAVTTAWTLHTLVLGDEEVSERFVLLISLALPLLPLYFFSNSRLKKFMENPVLREDILFKKILRQALWIEILLAVLSIVYGVYGGLNVVLLNNSGNAVDSFTSALFYGGAFTLLALWSYSFQKKTQR